MAIYILGMNAYHADASAVLLKDGEIVAVMLGDVRSSSPAEYEAFQTPDSEAVRERYYERLLLDEVQDTAPAQWKIAGALTAQAATARLIYSMARDRMLPPGKPLYLTVAAATADFSAASLAGARLRLIFKPRAAARPRPSRRCAAKSGPRNRRR